ncbi:hypothetical protein [Rhizobium sp. RU36D]|uniref:hypothetical protein n=1 Tax=Rhizobium sp. RU36D TaxID=1907415 RepID=UPI0015C48DE2|nr:hypothetical protein [Rhizobium sp. RU36D]
MSLRCSSIKNAHPTQRADHTFEAAERKAHGKKLAGRMSGMRIILGKNNCQIGPLEVEKKEKMADHRAGTAIGEEEACIPLLKATALRTRLSNI